MPWQTPSLRTVREMVRNDVIASLSGAVTLGNSVLRVISDATAAVAHLTMRYIDWLARQLMPDTAEKEWLDRHGNIWLTNADNTTGRKTATYASGTITLTGLSGIVVPSATQFASSTTTYETTADVTLGSTGVPAPARALTPGIGGNMEAGDTVGIVAAVGGADSVATVVSMDNGTDEETDDELRTRILFRIQRPPMGGDADDYELWTLAVSGVTRAWASPNEMGVGTVTVRFLMDDLRPPHGLPNSGDIVAVADYLDTVRPVAVKECFVVAPIPYFYDLSISGLATDTPEVRANIEAAIKDMEKQRSAPGQTMYRSWVDEAIAGAIGEDHHELTFSTTAMPSPGYMPFVGNIIYT
jgi:uncharacterized phage protein gp47/JayE